MTFRIKEEHYYKIGHLAALHRYEICGILSAHADGTPADMYECGNVAQRPEHTYEVGTEQHFSVFSDMEAKGTKLAAIYHSHVESAPEPSSEDLMRAFYPDAVYIIAGPVERRIGVITWELRAWRIENRQPSQVQIILEPEESDA